MSLTGIDKVKTSATMFVDAASKGMVTSTSRQKAHINTILSFPLNYSVQSSAAYTTKLDDLHVEYNVGGSHTSSSSRSYVKSIDFINVEKTLTNPSTGFVNLNFAFIDVQSSLQSQSSTSVSRSNIQINVQSGLNYSNSSSQKSVLSKGLTSLVVENDLTYSYSLNAPEVKSTNSKSLNVLSTNSEYEITLSLDGTSLPDVNVFYPNVSERIEIELDEDTVWA